MGGKPKAHTTEGAGKQEDLSHYKLNLSPAQLEEVAAKLLLEPAEKPKLSAGANKPPAGELMLTYRGRYVRITYDNNGNPIGPIKPPT